MLGKLIPSMGGTGRRVQELPAIFFLSLSVFLAVSLFSYHPEDPSINTITSSDTKIHNLTGIVGSYLSDILMQSFGFASFVFVILFFVVGFYYLIAQLIITRKPIKVLGTFLFVVIFSSLLSLVASKFQIRGATLYAGGIVGEFCSQFLVKYCNVLGAYILVLGGLIASFILATGCSLISFFLFLKHPWQILSQFFRKTISLLHFRFQKTQIITPMAIRSTPWLPPEPKNKFFRFKMPSFRMPSLKSWIPAFAGMTNKKTQVIAPIQSVPIPLTPPPPRYLEGKIKDGSFACTQDDKNTLRMAGKNKLPELPPRNLPPKSLPPQRIPPPDFKNFKLPELSFLQDNPDKEIKVQKNLLLKNSELLEQKLKDFGVEGRVSQVRPGPVITLYEFAPASGIKVSKIANLSDDLALSLSALSVRIIAPIPGKNVVGIEIPNETRQMVSLRDLLENQAFGSQKYHIPIPLGKGALGDPYIADLFRMPHLLVAGATGSGKSVFVNSLICSLLYRFKPDQVRFIMIDPKMLELSYYDDIPHLLLPVVIDPRKASLALKWAVREMEKRYDIMAKIGARNVDSFNQRIEMRSMREKLQEHVEVVQPMPYIIIFIDELADLMMVTPKDVEISIARLAQMARAAGIHLIVATQRPSVDVITGLIKANFPARISFQVSSKIDSRTILDTGGAERLLGDGDMLYLAPGTAKVKRIHGAYISDQEIKQIADFLRAQSAPDYNNSILQWHEEEKDPESPEDDELYQEAVTIVRGSRVASISMVQRRLRIGYNRAARMIERMEMDGIVGPQDGAKPREVLVE